MGKRELVALLSLSSWCPVIVVWLFLAVAWVCLQFVIVVFPDHTHLIFCIFVIEQFLITQMCSIKFLRFKFSILYKYLPSKSLVRVINLAV